MGSDHGLTDEALLAVADVPAGTFADDTHPALRHFDSATCAALDYADAMTVDDVDDARFARLARHFNDDQMVELTEIIAWENASARFNRALRVESQHLWHRKEEAPS